MPLPVMYRYPLLTLSKISRSFSIPRSADPSFRSEAQTLTFTATVYGSIDDLSHIQAFPGTLSMEEVEAELVEKRHSILSCPTQGIATCAVDSVLAVARYLGIARNAIDVAFCRSSIPYPASIMLQFLDQSWTGIGTQLLNTKRDALQVAILSHMHSIGEYSSNGYLDPRLVWQMFNGIPSTSFTLVQHRTCMICLTHTDPMQESLSLIHIPNRFISSAAYARITSPPRSTIIRDLVQLRLSSDAVTVAAPCPQCHHNDTQEEVYIADRLPEVLAVGIENTSDGCLSYAADIDIDYRHLDQPKSAPPNRARYQLAALLHISGDGDLAHITASIRVASKGWIRYDGNKSPPISVFGQNDAYLNSAPQCVMALYKSRLDSI
ncbi:uncharacterized protein M437DRAFT_87858 [Aureobasidium melanogenum CBS 110374]|uniref:Uncharacterized protein n=1 Tax=Aureobasidium melanogenum (strain CBS 110374) TaxID=1043003 RepID=A0A074W9N5_AURM1|nr:uncharacterized protein M437DRAFT_87858 [Aureobasidium melanogenum CBS 110374]KEQ59246.1 hypothetical protein M437DRAFT_87858 [Aureobasidium melanogenum CBS 110374]